jgi:hypothetical protein
MLKIYLFLSKDQLKESTKVTHKDTGCYIRKHGYYILSTYCVESGEVVSVMNVYQ